MFYVFSKTYTLQKGQKLAWLFHRILKKHSIMIDIYPPKQALGSNFCFNNTMLHESNCRLR